MIQTWEKLPTQWIHDRTLRKFRWNCPEQANYVAALITYILLVQKTDAGYTQLSYSAICGITNLSREKVAKGLQVLEKEELIVKDRRYKTTCYKISSYGETPWGKVPVSRLFNSEDGALWPFYNFHLRSKNELNALKLYLLIITFRDEKINAARLSYDAITDYTGITRNDVRPAISTLINGSLINLDNTESSLYERGVVNLYRVRFIESRQHRGTLTRTL